MPKITGAFVAGALCLALSACGGGSTPTAASSSDVSQTTSSSATSSAAAPATTTGSSTGGSWTAAQCQQLATAMSLAAGGFAPNTSGSTDLSTVSDYLRKLGTAAPTDLQGDFNTLADGFQKFYNTLKAAGIDLNDPKSYSSQTAIATLGQAAQQLQSDVGTAAKHIQDRFQQICGTS